MSAEEKLGAVAIESQEKDEQEVVVDAIPVECGSAEDKEVVITPPRIARFEKVSFETFLESYKPNWIAMQKQLQNVPEGEAFGYDRQQLEEDARKIWEAIQLPRRSTANSAGYDFFFPYGHTEIPAGASIMVPTGIKAYIDPCWVLVEAPRSGLGMTYRLQLDNTIGIVDADYYNNKKNEGHIFVKLTNDSREGLVCVFEQQSRFCQGVFLPYGITVDDDVTAEREGGLGSTGA